MKKLYCAILFGAIAALSACAKPPSASREPAVSVPAVPDGGETEETEEVTALRLQDEYISLVERYIDDAVFRPVEESRTKKLSDLLLGHYDVTGRTDGGKMEYYIAVRREDAPVYDDFKNVSIANYSGPDTDGEELRIGYYNGDGTEILLYRLGGYTFLDMPFGYDTLDSFCFGLSGASGSTAHPSFQYAFNENGRAALDFLKSKPGLSFYDGNSPSVWFYYQNDDTVKFYSEPYPCQISLDDEKVEIIRGLLSSSETESGIATRQEAWTRLRKMDRSLLPTGASLILDDREYEFFGNHDTPGYMIVHSKNDNEFIALQRNEELYRLVMEEIQNVVGTDYRDFDPDWFKTPLKSAAMTFPEFLIPSGSGDETFTQEVRTQTIEDREKLNTLSKMMDRAINDTNVYGFSKCPYAATIDFQREDGRTLRIYVATDSCDSMAYEGRIGFEYGDQAELAALFDEAMFYRLE